MYDHSVLIVADSRGRELNAELAKYFEQNQYTLCWRKGLRLNQTADQIAPIITAKRPSLIYILNGICDVTTIRSYRPWSVAKRKPTPDSTLSSYSIEMDSLHAQLYPMSYFLGYKLMIIFAPLVGIDLATYNQDQVPSRSSQQLLLNDSIYLINKHSHTVNTSMGIVTPPLSSTTHVRRRGKYRFNPRMLSDGCHTTRRLSNYWAAKLWDNVTKNLDNYD